jgi:hypothetical protein
VHLTFVRDTSDGLARIYINAQRPTTGSAAAVGKIDNASALVLGSLSGYQDFGDWLWRKGAPFTWAEIEEHYFNVATPATPAGCVQIGWGMRDGAGTNIVSVPAGYAGTLSAASWTTSTRCPARTAA